jgi:cysteine desulfurase / selenocysteine lyase
VRPGRVPALTRLGHASSGRYHETVSTAAKPKLDAVAIRADFPIFEQQFHDKPLAYLDSANSSQKPRQVLDAMTHFYETSYANVHRSVYELAERSTAEFEAARDKVAALVNAPHSREIVFVRNATEALNLIAYSWGRTELGPGDVVIVTELEHHSNFVPWQVAARKTGADFRMLPLDDQGELRLDLLDEVAGDGNVRVVAAGLVSNSLGTVNPIEKLVAWAHDRGAIMVCDAAQAVPHRPVDVQALGVDFLTVSGHKLCGPSGIGFLWGRSELLADMEPFLYGGHMIRKVGLTETTFADLPGKFEAGTSPIAEAVGLGAAIDYLNEVGFDAIEAHEHELVDYALELLPEVPGIRLFGPPAERRAGIVLFDMEGIHPHDVAQVLDFEGVAIRAGHHCCQPLMAKLGLVATNRASFYLYTLREEIDQLYEGLLTVRAKLG